MIIKIDPGLLVYKHEIQGYCGKKYSNHPMGCPNLGLKRGCPPQPLIDKILDFDKEIFLIYVNYNVWEHAERMKEKHPNWTEGQLYNIRQWQGTPRSWLKKENRYAKTNYGVKIIESPEAHGINLDDLMKKVADIKLEWPPRNIARVISMGGTLICAS